MSSTEKDNLALALAEPSSTSTTTTTFSQRWTRAILQLHEPYLHHVIHPLTQMAARNPKRTMTAVVVLSLLLLVTGIATNFHLESDGDFLWTPDGVRTTAHRDYLYKPVQSGYSLPKRNLIVLLHHHNPTANVLDHAQAALQEMFTILDTVRDLPEYNQACLDPIQNNQNTCDIFGIPRFFNNSAALMATSVTSDKAAIQAISATTYPDGTRVSLSQIAGNAVRNNNSTTNNNNNNNLVEFAQSLRLVWEYPESSTSEEMERNAVEALLDLRNAWQKDNDNDDDAHPFALQVFADRSIDDEIERAIVTDIPLVPIVFVIMGTFTATVLARRHAVQSRWILGWMATLSVLLSIMSGYGFMFICGVSFTSMTQILPFVIFGIGLDDTFVIMGAYTRTLDKTTDVEQRIYETMQEVGTSITLTTLTSILAFGLGGLSTVPAVYWLCFYAMPTIAFVYIFQLTFFVGAIVLDEKRIMENRHFCCTWRTVETRDDTNDHEKNNDDDDDDRQPSDNDGTPNQGASSAPVPNIFERFIDWYAEFLLQPVVKVVVVVLFTALLGLCVWSALQLSVEFNVVDVMPQDSYASDFIQTQKIVSSRTPIDAYVYFRNVDQSLLTTQAQMKTYIQELVDLEEIPRGPEFFWLTDFESFVANETNNVGSLDFVPQLDAFLAREEYAILYAEDIARDEVTGAIHGSRVRVYMDNVDIEDVQDQVDALEAVEDVTKAQTVNQGGGDYAFFTYNQIFQIWEFYAACVDELILTTILGVVTVTGIALLFIPHWTAALFVLPMISILYLDLLGVMQWGGVHIDPVSYVSCVMSIGLLVDFVLHILLRYYECPGNRHEKTVATLKSMGVSILTGGVSTFLGALPLYFSTSTVFSTIFITFLGLSTLGVGHGLILLPVILSTIGPEEQILRSEQRPEQRQQQQRQEDQDAHEAQKSKSVMMVPEDSIEAA